MSHDDWDEQTKAAPSIPGEELATESQAAKAYLIVLTGTRLGSMVEVVDGMVIGRSHGSDFQIPEEGVSRQHIRLRSGADGKMIVEDLRSLNGTFVNGVRIESVTLTDGDKVRIGTTTILKFSYADRLEEHFQQQLREAALRDPLTRIFNRRSLDDHLAREVAFARRHNTELSLILFDIDHFKNVNDTYGHPAGDELLCGLASSLGRQIRAEDILARYGGEEFALLCRGTAGAVAFTVADRLRLSLGSQALVPALPDLRVTISGGVAAMPAPDISSERALVEAADQALYKAKNAGRNRIFLYRSTTQGLTMPPGASRRPPSGPALRGVQPRGAAGRPPSGSSSPAGRPPSGSSSPAGRPPSGPSVPARAGTGSSRPVTPGGGISRARPAQDLPSGTSPADSPTPPLPARKPEGGRGPGNPST